MTDKLKQTPASDANINRTTPNPVDELARIMGYNNNPDAESGADIPPEMDPAANLEAELMREFGIENLDPTAVPAPEPENVESYIPQSESVPSAPIIEPVEAPVADYTQPVEPAAVETVQSSVPSSEAAPADDIFDEMSRYDVPQASATVVEEPQPPVAPEVEQPIQTEVVEAVEPVEPEVPAAPETPSVGAAPFDVDNFSSDLEQELAKLQMGLSGGLVEQPVTEEVATPQEEVVVEPSTAYAPEDVPAEMPPVASFEETAVEPQEVPSVDPQAFVDMSGIVETDNEIEQATEFEIPEIETAAPIAEPDASFDADLDSELEREFSQMFTEENLSQDSSEVNPYQEPAPVEDAANNAPSAEEVGQFFDLGALQDEPQQTENIEEQVAEIAVAPIVAQPERIDVSGDQFKEPVQETAGSGGLTGGKTAAVGLFALLLVGAGGYFIYNNASSGDAASGEPVIIKADNSPIKEEPADPGGASVPNQDQAVYDQVEGNDTSVASQPSLVEGTEEPIDIVQRTLDPSVLPLEGRGAEIKNEERLVASNPAADESQNNTAEPLIVPKKVRTVVVQSDGTIITREEPAAAPAQTEIAAANTAANTSGQADTQVAEANSNNVVDRPIPAATPAQPVANNQQAANSSQSSAQTETPASNTPTEVAAVATPPATEQPAAAPAAAEQNVASSNFSGYYMQIASQPSLAAAQSSYQNLVNRYNSILGGRGVEYQQAVIEGKGTFHRVRIQVGERSEANALCSRYKAAGGSCFVAR